MFLVLIVLIVCLIAIFPNVLFYTMSLLIVSVVILFIIVSLNYVRTLLFIIMTIVYVGAIIILIGYICAVCPNFITVYSAFNNFVLFVPFSFLLCSIPFSQDSSKLGRLSDYFFSSWGFPIFVIIAFMLFLTLIIVTSQYSSPQGPLRSFS